MKEVQGNATIQWTVRLPAGKETSGVACDDPAVEAVLSHISQSSVVYLWGTLEEPAAVFAEIDERDVEIEADERIEEPEGGHVRSSRPGS